MKDSALYTIRPLQKSDIASVNKLSIEANMGELTLNDTTLIATDSNGFVIGFLRIMHHDGDAYVNPVVVDPTWHHKGVGTSLMNAALRREGTLLFVARGKAVGFYERLGCEAVPWSRIASAIAQDCAGCDIASSCNPYPMRMMTNPS